MTNGRQVVLLEAKIRSDSIVGTEPTGRARVAMPADQVKSVESLEFSQFRTTLLAGFAAAAFLATTLLLLATGGD